MATIATKPPIVRQSIALRLDQREAIRELVVLDLKHGNVSRYIQDLIDADLARRAAEKERAA